MSSELVRSLADLRRTDELAFGGKSSSLGDLMSGGIPVPPGFAVSTEAFDEFLEADGLGDRVSARLAGLDPSDVAEVNRASEDVAQLMRTAELPAEVREAVEREYAAIGEAEPPVAVRSSARGEDSADATFAGQQETYLWVRGAEGVGEALRDCWISLYSPPAITYRARMAADETPAMGVTVQLMVDAAVSGVMFTCSPTTGDPSLVAINSSWGLGLGVVGGDVTPDEYSVSKVTREVLRKTISDKHVEYLPDPAGRGTRRVDVPAERRTAPTLEDAVIGPIVDVARRVERHFGSHQDIEWAIAGSGEFPANFYVLQSRPVTVAGQGGSPTVEEKKGKSSMSLLLGTFGVKREEG